MNRMFWRKGKNLWPGFLNLIWICLLMGMVSCDNDPDADIKDIQLAIEFVRTDSMMYEASKFLQNNSEADYHQVYQEYLASEREFFSLWIGLDEMYGAGSLSVRQADSLLAENLGPLLADPNFNHLLDTIQQVFPRTTEIKNRISPPLKRLVKYIPAVEIPAFRTHANGYFPQADIRSVDQVLFLGKYFSFGLHYYLGPDLKYYPVNIPQYQRERFDKKYLDVMMVKEIAEGMVEPIDMNQQSTFLDQMIREGIKQYFVHQLLPHTPDSTLFFYSSSQMEWANYYEARIYKELMDDIYSTDFLSYRDYLTDKPYTTDLSLESAPRLGEYLGWKIVSSYMEKNPNETLEDLIAQKDYRSIFKQARYKPLSYDGE